MSDIFEINIESGESSERAYTKEEKVAFTSMMQDYLESGAIVPLDTSAKDSAIEKLTKLGLTEEEAKAIAGL